MSVAGILTRVCHGVQDGVIMDTSIQRDEAGARVVSHPMDSLFAERLQGSLPPGHKLALAQLFTDTATDGAFRTHNMEIRLANMDAASYHKASSYVKILSVPELKHVHGETVKA